MEVDCRVNQTAVRTDAMEEEFHRRLHHVVLL